MRFYILIVLLELCSLFGCSASSGVMTIGPEKYMVSIDVNSDFYGPADASKKAIEEAKAYCSSLGKKLSVETSENKNTSTTSNWTIIFHCIAE